MKNIFLLFVFAFSCIFTVKAQNLNQYQKQLETILNTKFDELAGKVIEDDMYTEYETSYPLEPFQNAVIFEWDFPEYKAEFTVKLEDNEEANKLYLKLIKLTNQVGQFVAEGSFDEKVENKKGEYSRFTRFFKGDKKILDLVASNSENIEGEYTFNISIVVW